MNFAIKVVESIDSTNAELLRAPLSEAPVGTALLAHSQTGGRGRSERIWESPIGGMHLSVVLSPSDPRGLSLVGARAVVRLLESFEIQSQLRWPNDVMIQGKKVAGVLPVARYQGNVLERAVLGVGLNVAQAESAFPAELRSQVTTLKAERPERPWHVEQVTLEYLEILGQELAEFERFGLAKLCQGCESLLEGFGSSRVPFLVEPGRPPEQLAPIAGLSEDGALMLLDGRRLEMLGRHQRFRFSDELET